MKRISQILTILVLLILPAFLYSQDSYNLPSGHRLTVANTLPEKLASYFKPETILRSLSNFSPESDLHINIGFDDSQFSIGIIVKNFSPDKTPNFKARATYPYVLTTQYPFNLMWTLYRWYGSAYTSRTFTNDLRIALAEYKLQFYCILQKSDEQLIFLATILYGDQLSIQSPIISVTPDYGTISILPGKVQNIQNYLSQNLYPLDPPINTLTDEKNTSYLIYRFFNQIEE